MISWRLEKVVNTQSNGITNCTHHLVHGVALACQIFLKRPYLNGVMEWLDLLLRLIPGGRLSHHFRTSIRQLHETFSTPFCLPALEASGRGAALSATRSRCSLAPLGTRRYPEPRAVEISRLIKDMIHSSEWGLFVNTQIMGSRSSGANIPAS